MKRVLIWAAVALVVLRLLDAGLVGQVFGFLAGAWICYRAWPALLRDVQLVAGRLPRRHRGRTL